MNTDESKQQFSFFISHFLSITMYRCYYVQFTVSVNKMRRKEMKVIIIIKLLTLR